MRYEDWGLINYDEATTKQLKILEKVASGELEETIIFCRHPSIVTIGRATEEKDILSWSGEVHKSQRGGRATYHGPEQLVVYPIINLDERNKDVHQHMRNLENSVIDCFEQHFKLNAEGGIKDATGVWVNSKKLASVGIAVRSWVSYHGLAVNLNKDPLAFSGISPCGFSTSTMSNLEEIIGTKTTYSSFVNKLKPFLNKHFSN